MKNKNLLILNVTNCIFVFFIFIMHADIALCENNDGYHIRNGTPQTALYDREFIFSNTPDDIPFITDFPMNELVNDPEIEKIERLELLRGSIFEIYIKTEENKVEKVWLRYWIHTSVSNAEEALVEGFNSPLGRFNAIDIGSEGEIGNNCWYSDYSIDFVRNNVRVRVCTDWTPPLPELIIKVSKKVDTLLKNAEKINDASIIHAPEIVSVENLSEEINVRESFILKVNAVDPNHQKLRYWLSFYPRLSVDGILKPYFVESGEKTFTIWVMNEDFIVSSKEVTF